MSKKVFLILFCLLGYLPSVHAQYEHVPDSLELAFLPALAFNSDLGLIAGGLINWYHYKDEVKPYYSYTNIAGVFSTRGLASFEISRNKPNVFGTKFRIYTSIYASRFFEDAYLGIGNYGKLPEAPANTPNYYEFQSFSMGLTARARYPLFVNVKEQQLDVLAIINFDYETPWDNGSSRLLSIDRPTGFDGGRTFMFGAGLVWEARNSEFNPTRGTYLNTSIEQGSKIWGSNFNTFVWKHEMSHYLTFHIIRDITFANRVYLKHTSGEVPYWKLSYLGDEETLRGYQSKRFLDDNAFVLNNELRTWLFEIPSLEMRLGGTLFFDIGRTFANGTSFDTITNDLKYTFGLGGTASFFTPDFIIRTDVGFSEEDFGVYITTGYLF